jgi:uncharacterized membrane protein (UPF0127 family)
MPWRVTNTTRGKLLAERAEEARSFGSRFIGLMGRRQLPRGEGLHIVPCNSIHTFFMRLAIDALFLDQRGAVIKAYPALPPWRMTGLWLEARSVLELPAGVVAESGTEAGDLIRFEPSG